VIDPEWFPDAGESDSAFGRGAVYTRTCTGIPLRTEPYPRAADLLDTCSVPTPTRSPQRSKTACTCAGAR